MNRCLFPVDSMVYVKDWIQRGMGRESHQIYTWFVQFNRAALEGTEISKIFYLPFSNPTPKGNGVREDSFQEVSPPLFALIQSTPGLKEKLVAWSSSAPFDSILDKIEEKKVDPDDPVVQKLRREFWEKFYPNFTGYLLGEGVQRLDQWVRSKPFDPEKLNGFIEGLALEYWKSGYRDSKFKCGPFRKVD